MTSDGKQNPAKAEWSMGQGEGGEVASRQCACSSLIPAAATALLRQRPHLGDQPIHQVGPHAREAESGHAGGDTLLGGALALAGQLLAAGWPMDVMVGDGAADGRLGGAKVGGELGDAPALVQ
jgi:hypothetical protein